MQKLDGKTQNIVADNIEQLQQLFPEAFTEGRVDFDKLRSVLGDHVETEGERYSFNWHGKSDAIKIALKQSTGTLRPDKESSKNWDDTQNLYIEGDNLEVLRIMQSSYRNKIKMIYIDPPYNTGKDFVYSDDFNDTVADYKEKIGEKYKTNANSSGRYHTNWLNMMYPRLKLARNLLTEDGVIFISIDDNEQANLKKLCDEIFGESNFLTTFTWIKREKASGVPPKNMILPNFEYVLAYQKNEGVSFKGQDRSMASYKKNEDGRYWRLMPIQATGEQDNYFDILNRETGKKYNGNWAFSESKIKQLVDQGKIVFPKNDNGKPTRLVYADEMANDTSPIFANLGKFDSESSTKELIKLLDGKIFDFPKPVTLLRFLMDQVLEDGIVLDFFSGSSATSHATMQLNAEDGGNRKFIMVQLPEETDEKSEAFKAGYKTIPEIGRERIRRAGEKILADNAEELTKREQPLDIGFKAFRLDTTNLTQWDEKTQDVEATIFDNIEAVKDGRTQEDLVYEVLLKYGVDISVPIETEDLDGKTLYKIAGGYLTLCLDEGLDQSFIEKLAEKKPERLVFRDTGFVDNTVKINAEMTLKKHGITDIKVL